MKANAMNRTYGTQGR